MANFQHALLDELKHHQAELAELGQQEAAPPPRRTPLWWGVALTATAAAAVIAAVAVIPAGPTAPAANGVTINDDGTITLEMDDIVDADAAAAKLREAGIPTDVYRDADCPPGQQQTIVGAGSMGPAGFMTIRMDDGATIIRPDLMPPDLRFTLVSATLVAGEVETLAVSHALLPSGAVECAPPPVDAPPETLAPVPPR